MNATRRPKETIASLKRELRECEASFDLRWKADMRAIKRWQKATGKKLTWPDHADLCVWLMEQLEEKRQRQATIHLIRQISKGNTTTLCGQSSVEFPNALASFNATKVTCDRCIKLARKGGL